MLERAEYEFQRARGDLHAAVRLSDTFIYGSHSNLARPLTDVLWVVYIRHNNLSAGTRTFKPGTRGAELVPELNVVSDHIFTKSKSNALTSETFAAFIQEHGITDFYLTGADAAACVKGFSTVCGVTGKVAPFCVGGDIIRPRCAVRLRQRRRRGRISVIRGQ